VVDKKINYLNLIQSLDSLLESDNYEFSILANSSALLKEMLKELSWVGFYILHEDTLLLGPFQGKVACTEIKVGKGVCGTAVERKETIVVPNVHEFPGHIACDAASNSEIVIPIFIEGKTYGVLDIDSKKFNRFSSIDRRFLEQVVMIISKHLARISNHLRNI
jgi:GAF domain-containing protein